MMMKSVTVFFVVILAAFTANAQHVPLVSIDAESSTFSTWESLGVADTPHSIADIVRGNLFYFDATKPVAVTQFPRSIGEGRVILLISQRFTSPSVETYLDSIRFFCPTGIVGDIKLHILRDTILRLGNGIDAHLPNITGSVYSTIDTARILREDVPSTGANIRVPFAGPMLPIEWHVVFQPIDRGDFQPAFTLAFSMDSVSLASLTPEIMRVSFYYGGTTSGIGPYTLNTANPDYFYLPNILMSASVRYETGTSVAAIPDDGGIRLAGVYPHPVAQTKGDVTIALNVGYEQSIELALYDVMGRRVRTIPVAVYPYGNHLLLFPTTGLAPGTYLLRANGKQMSATKTVVITP